MATAVVRRRVTTIEREGTTYVRQQRVFVGRRMTLLPYASFRMDSRQIDALIPDPVGGGMREKSVED